MCLARNYCYRISASLLGYLVMLCVDLCYSIKLNGAKFRNGFDVLFEVILMRHAFLVFLYLASQVSFAGTVVNEQFHDSSNEGITVYNESFYPVTIYSRFLIPGLQPEALRNTGTKFTVNPRSEITYYLPSDTQVVATNGVYWDSPDPKFPDEKELVKVVSGSITRLPARDFLFRD